MEFTGQIFGHENDIKSIMVLLLTVTAVVTTLTALGSHDIIQVDFEKIRNIKTLTAGISLNTLLFMICLLLGEITAGKVSAKEL